MNLLLRLIQSTVGRKILMAGSGAILVLFVLGHMVGNLQWFLGPESLNRYAHLLQSNRELLWIVRLVLLAMVAIHISSALSLKATNSAARPTPYESGKPPVAASLASRTMLMGGLVVFFFLLFHLLHYTVRVDAVNMTGLAFGGDPFLFKLEGNIETFDVHKMVTLGFSKPLVVLVYALGIGCLCLHVSHGISAMFQSLGLRSYNWWPRLQWLARTLSIVLFVGYMAVPVAVILGMHHGRLEGLKTSAPAVVKEAR